MSRPVLMTQTLLQYYNMYSTAEIVLHPLPRLAAIGVSVSFNCKINNSHEPHWVINGDHAKNGHQKERTKSLGFNISEESEGTVVILTLTVNATAEKNGTQIFCLSVPNTQSSTALLMIISGKNI